MQKLLKKMAELSKRHGIEMFQKKDSANLKAIENMKTLMQDPKAMQTWFETKRLEFDQLPENR